MQSKDSKESSPTPQLKSINSLVLSLLIVQLSNPWASLVAQMVKHLLVVQETRVQSLGWKDALEMASFHMPHPYMTTGKTIVLTRWTFVGKVMPVLFNMLSRLLLTVLPRSKRLLISWLQSPSAVILEPQK